MDVSSIIYNRNALYPFFRRAINNQQVTTTCTVTAVITNKSFAGLQVLKIEAIYTTVIAVCETFINVQKVKKKNEYFPRTILVFTIHTLQFYTEINIIFNNGLDVFKIKFNNSLNQ